MTDEQQGGIGCLVILLVVGGCVLHWSDNPEVHETPKESVVDASSLMEEIVQKERIEAEVCKRTVREAYAKEQKRRDEQYAADEARLLSLVEIDRRKLESLQEFERQKLSKEDALRSFALKESPNVWKTMQMMAGERDRIEEKIATLSKTLRQFGKEPSTDEVILRLSDYKRQIDFQLRTVGEKLESAYIAAKKYEAMPHRKDFNDLMRKSIEDGIFAAEMAEKRYIELKEKENLE